MKKEKKENQNKNNSIRLIVLVVALSIILFLIIASFSLPKVNNQNKKNIHSGDSHIISSVLEDISEQEIIALNTALNDEYKARATYEKVISNLGEVKPFSNILNAENNHISELTLIYQKYSIQVPIDNWYEKVPSFNNIQDACKAGVQAEIENANLYDNLLKNVDSQDIINVFISLRDASRNNHLPAFQRCAS